MLFSNYFIPFFIIHLLLTFACKLPLKTRLHFTEIHYKDRPPDDDCLILHDFETPKCGCFHTDLIILEPNLSSLFLFFFFLHPCCSLFFCSYLSFSHTHTHGCYIKHTSRNIHSWSVCTIWNQVIFQNSVICLTCIVYKQRKTGIFLWYKGTWHALNQVHKIKHVRGFLDSQQLFKCIQGYWVHLMFCSLLWITWKGVRGGLSVRSEFLDVFSKLSTLWSTFFFFLSTVLNTFL